jgi:hypothetical protein
LLPIPYLRAFVFDGKFIRVSGNERVPAKSLCPEKKITMLSATSPTFFSFKTFLIPLFLKRQCRKKKKAQTQMGNDSQSKKKKKVSGCERHRKGNLSKKRSKSSLKNNSMFNQLIQSDMAAVQFILSVIMAICAVAMFLSAVFIHANPSMVVSALLFIICYGAFLLVKISYKELKSE